MTIEEELENRIQQLESNEYDFPPRFSAKDYIITAVVAVICVIVIIVGGFL